MHDCLEFRKIWIILCWNVPKRSIKTLIITILKRQELFQELSHRFWQSHEFQKNYLTKSMVPELIKYKQTFPLFFIDIPELTNLAELWNVFINEYAFKPSSNSIDFTETKRFRKIWYTLREMYKQIIKLVSIPQNSK